VLNNLNIQLNWVTLKFSGSTGNYLEKLFNEKYFINNLIHLRYCHFFTILFYLLAGLVDYFLFPNDLIALFSIRFLIVVPIIIAGFIFTYSDHYKNIWQQVSFFYILITGWSFIIFTIIAQPPNAYGYYVGILFCMMFGYTFIRERFIYASVAGLILVIGYLIASSVVLKMPVHNLLHSNFYLFLANFLGMLIARHLEISARRDFYLEHQLSIEQKKFLDLNNQLEEKVEERTGELQNEIVERRQADKKLKESERKYRLIAENVNDVIWTMDMDMNFTYISPAIEKMQGWTAEETVSLTVDDILTPQAIETAVKRLETHMAHGAKTGDYNISDTLELEMYRKDGSTIRAEVLASAIVDENENLTGILGVTRDITERKELEAQLHRSQKMESVGLLAGGVAHDLNNVLAGIVSYPELLLMDLPEDSKLRKPIETMQESGHRATAVVQDLLTVARGVAVSKEPLNLNDLIRDYLNSPEFKKLIQFNPTVTVRTNLDNDLLNVNGSYVHIRKTAMNLVSNASEAIDDNGSVTVSTQNRYVEVSFKGYDNVNAGEYVVLKVSDNGSGISPHDLKRIFEPFYTKKVMGKSGTGLGLAVVWNTIQDHNGHIDVTSDTNGTSFELYFPITRLEVPDKALSIPLKNYQGNGETILVVDDVESQREISCKMLESLGYETNAVTSGEEAIEFINNNPTDLLLLDMIMDPGINGRETYARIIEIQPKQKAIIVSGYAQTDDVRATQKLGAGRYVKKPLTLENIGLAIKAELEK